jgi:microcystin-dependent protein
MADPFVAEVRIFPFNFPPKGWAFCDGQLMPLSQNTALFALLGTTYGGDGKSTFALPDLQGSAPMHPGQGNGLSRHDLGETGGSETVTLLATEMPTHTHALQAAQDPGDNTIPGPGVSLAVSVGGAIYDDQGQPQQGTMAADALTVTGGSLPHNNLMPYLTFNFNIALQGVFPPRG